MKYRDISWQRTNLNTGDPIGMPHLHLTIDGEKTCCGQTIPQFGTVKYTRRGKPLYQIDEGCTGRECERCFTDKRRDELLRDV